MIAVDTNVIAYLWIPGTHTAAAERLVRKDPEWVAPLLWRSEFRNVLARYLRSKLIDLVGALQIAAEAENQMRGREFNVPFDAVLRLADGSARSAYDCEFVALAEELAVPLVTTDRQVLRSFPDIAYPLDQYAGRPT